MPLQEPPTVAEKLEVLRSRLCDQDFLMCRGLGNEVPFHVIAYAAQEENVLREGIDALVKASQAGEIPARIVHFDLWDVFCDLCEHNGILSKMSALEARRGSASLLNRIHTFASAEKLVERMHAEYLERHEVIEPGRDAMLISGVGKVYPFVRAHAILENAQPVFTDIPVVLAYPGTYDGQSLRLFDTFADANYYRAFNLI